MRAFIFSIVVFGSLIGSAAAQTKPWRFHWRKGDVLTYRVEHNTEVAETKNGSRTTTTSKLKLVKRWQITEVDEKGTATMQMSLASMRSEQKRPDGEMLRFDSADAKNSTPALKKYFAKFIGKPLAVVQVNAYGQVVVSKLKSLERYEADPPFILVLSSPGDAMKNWKRRFTVTLAPPLGTGEKYHAVQTYTVKSQNPQFAAIKIETKFKNLPKSQLDQAPLFQKQRQGTIIFDHRNGRLHSADLHILRELQNHQGPATSYRFESKYKEEYVGK